VISVTCAYYGKSAPNATGGPIFGPSSRKNPNAANDSPAKAAARSMRSRSFSDRRRSTLAFALIENLAIRRPTKVARKLFDPCGPAGHERASAGERPQRTPRDQRVLPQPTSRAPRELRYERGQFGRRGLVPVAMQFTAVRARFERAPDKGHLFSRQRRLATPAPHHERGQRLLDSDQRGAFAPTRFKAGRLRPLGPSRNSRELVEGDGFEPSRHALHAPYRLAGDSLRPLGQPSTGELANPMRFELMFAR
jgi:hypothetical protein